MIHPPQSLLSPANNDEENTPNNDEENPPLLLEVEATLVVDSPPVQEATLIVPNNSPVYEATRISDATPGTSTDTDTGTGTGTGGPCWKRFKNYLIVALLSGMATAIAMLVVNGNTGDSVDKQLIEQTTTPTTPPTQEREPTSSTRSTILPTTTLNSTIQLPVPLSPTNGMSATPNTTLIPTTEALAKQSEQPSGSTAVSYELTSTPTPRPVIQSTNMPIPVTLPSFPRPTLSPMEQLQLSAMELVPSEKIVPDDFPWRENVAVDGDTIIVGAPRNNIGRGFALVYIRDGNGEWMQEAKLEGPGGGAWDRFGWSVGIHGDTVIVGSHGDDTNGGDSGAVHLFVRNGGIWIHHAKLLAPDGAVNDNFGWSVGIFGDTAIIGAPYDDLYDNDDGGGSAYLFVKNGGTWIYHAKLLAPDGAEFDQFGASVGIFGDTVVVGVPGDDDSGTDSGSVHLFALNNTIWTYQTKLVAPDGSDADNFGSSVGIFGDTVIVGANGDDEHSGSAHLFALNNNIWMHQAKIVAPDGVADGQFGYSVGIFGNAAIIGAYGDGGNGVNSGAVYLFVQNEYNWDHHAKLLAPKTGEQFGASVGIYNGTMVTGSCTGEVYLFWSHSD